MDEFHFRALELCRDRGMESPANVELVACAMRVRAYQDAIQPFIKMKVDMLMLKAPRFVAQIKDGQVVSLKSIEPDWTPEERWALDQIDECMAAEAKRYGLTESINA